MLTYDVNDVCRSNMSQVQAFSFIVSSPVQCESHMGTALAHQVFHHHVMYLLTTYLHSEVKTMSKWMGVIHVEVWDKKHRKQM